MGLDGFSMSNLGMHRNFTSAQMANEADDLSRQTLENQITDVDGISKKEKAGAKDDEAAYNGMIPFIPSDDVEEEENGEQEQDSATGEQAEIVSQDEEDYDKYHFRFNADDKIEIWDNDSQKVVKTISVQEAQKVVGKFDKVPGFLVNKTI